MHFLSATLIMFFFFFDVTAQSNRLNVGHKVCIKTSDLPCQGKNPGIIPGGSCHIRNTKDGAPECFYLKEQKPSTQPEPKCHWTSDFPCRDKTPGARVLGLEKGICEADSLVSGEPKCIFLKDAANLCRWTSEKACRDKPPGPISRGLTCQIDRMEFGEPRCILVKDQEPGK
jgi:hypothetical protein